MEMPEIIALACLAGLIVVAAFLWRQQQNLRRLESELSGLAAAFRAHRGDALAVLATAGAAAATLPEAAGAAPAAAGIGTTADEPKAPAVWTADVAKPAAAGPAPTLAEEIMARVAAGKQAAEGAAAASALSR